MTNRTRLTALLTLAVTLTLAGCGDASDKKQADAKMDAEPGMSGGSYRKVPPGVKAPAPPSTEAKPEPAPKEVKETKEAKVDPEVEAEITKSFAKLSPEDRKLAIAQRFCAVEDENRLGSMGPPVKLTLKGKTVFVCCGSCKKEAMAEPDKVIAKAEELKKKSAAPAK
jgi:hypothetical protein